MKRTLAIIGLSFLFGACTLLPADSGSNISSSASGELIGDETAPETGESLEVPTPPTATGSISWKLDGQVVKLGNANTSVVFREYIDYDCAYCREYVRTQRRDLVEPFVLAGVLTIERTYAPITPWGERLSRTALCSAENGKLQEVDEALLISPPTNEAALQTLLKKLALTKTLASCMAQKNLLTPPTFPSGKPIERVPAFAVGEREWIGIESDYFVRAAIEEAL